MRQHQAIMKNSHADESKFQPVASRWPVLTEEELKKVEESRRMERMSPIAFPRDGRQVTKEEIELFLSRNNSEFSGENTQRRIDLAEKVDSAVKSRISPSVPLRLLTTSFYEDTAEIWVFYNTDADLKECSRNGVSDDIVRYFQEELNRVGRTKRTEYIQFDSYENVVKNYQGSYYLRLRG